MLGLPRSIDAMSTHLVLVVSTLCAACKTLVGSFEGAIPEGLTVVVTASDLLRMRKWAVDHGLPTENLVFDMSIVNGLGVSSSPAAVGFIRGMAAFALHLGGRAALDDLLARRISIRKDVPSSAASDRDPRPVDSEPGV